MYRILRNTHLFLGLFLCLFIITYGVSSIRLAHPSWYSLHPKITEWDVDVPGETDIKPRALARTFMETYGFRGALDNVRKTKDGFRIGIHRPGTYADITWNATTHQAHIKTQVNDFPGMLQAIHFATVGIGTGYWLQDLWGLMVVVVSLALIALGVTGLYLWFKVHAERLIGTALLVVGLGGGIAMVILLYTA